MKKIFTVLVLLVLLGACNKPNTKEAVTITMPPGYKLMCSTTGGKYSLWFPHSNRLSVTVWNDKEKAMEFALHWEKQRLIAYSNESDAYIWEECQ